MKQSLYSLPDIILFQLAHVGALHHLFKLGMITTSETINFYQSGLFSEQYALHADQHKQQTARKLIYTVATFCVLKWFLGWAKMPFVYYYST